MMRAGNGVSFFSKEMTYEELGEQFVAQELGIPPNYIAEGKCTDEDYIKMEELQEEIAIGSTAFMTAVD